MGAPMKRREFLVTAAAGGAALMAKSPVRGQKRAGQEAEGRIYASPAEAIASPREELAYVVGTHAGTKVEQPDFLASVDVDPESKTYGQIVHRLSMPSVGDE